MQERPILFSGEMVRAILAGRKTQTRRVIKDYPWTRHPYYFCGLRNGLGYPASEGVTWAGFTCEGYHSPCYVKCPYGQPGDLLWVRETWGVYQIKGDGYIEFPNILYKADSSTRLYLSQKVWNYVTDSLKWRPSIHMPRWASRITLEVNDVRAERLQEIGAADAVAEGLVSWPSEKSSATHYGLTIADVWETDPRLTYKRLWNDINMSRGHSWDSNPWVWVIEFRRKI